MANVKIEKEEVLSEDVAKMSIDNEESDLSRVKKIKSERAGFLTEDDSNSGEIAGDILDLPEDVIKENEKLEKQIMKEEQKKSASNMKKHMEEMDESQEQLKYKRLMHLLDRSKFYAKFLLEKMALKKEEEKAKAEKLAKRAATKNAKKEAGKENGAVAEAEVKSHGHGTRGSKRQLEADKAPQPEVKRKRRGGKAITDSSILEVIDEKELERMAANTESEDESELKEEVKSEEVKPEDDKIPELLEGVQMRPYQMEGFKWLVALYENGMNGILADEMGLGKTLQCISLIAHLMGNKVVGPFVVCGPLSTLPNWMSEFKRFAPRIPTVLFHGNQERRNEVLREIGPYYKISGIPNVKFYPVVITSYDIIIRERSALSKFQWRYIIVDEGHRLKNYQCRLVQELKMYHSSNRLLLTGTPLQNNLTELWSLLNFLLPEIFDDLYVFEAWFQVDDLKGKDADRKIVELERKEHVISTLHQILSPFLLRRVKADVDLQLPKKKELIVYCPLSPLQDELYRATLNRSIINLVKSEEEEKKIEYQANGRMKRKAKKQVDYSIYGDKDLTDEVNTGKSNSKVEAEIEKWIELTYNLPAQKTPKYLEEKVISSLGTSIKMKNITMMLRKIVNHPYLVKWDVDVETGDYVVDEAMIGDSGKLAVLDQMLKHLIEHGHRTLIFSQMTMMLDVLADYLDLVGLKFCRLDGAMNLDDRATNIEAFKNDPEVFVFLVSTRAGGLGINLTTADTVIIYDSDWNPQCDLQAQDRCHRIGQTRPVVVYRLIASDTIDERIIERAAAKRKLEKLIIQKGKFKTALASADDSKKLSVDELVELLKTRDHSGEYNKGVVSGQVFTAEQMEALMDRSDLEGDQPQSKVAMQGVFKRLDVNPTDQPN